MPTTSGTPPVNQRGVIILHPVQVPDPAPSPSPVPAPNHTPDPAPAPVPPPPPPPPPAPMVRDCPRPFAKTDVRLDAAANDAGADPASSEFRRALERKLQRHGVVVVDLARPFAMDETMPADLAPWVSEVKNSGGHVSTLSYCQTSRGLFSALRGLFGGHPENPYAAADSYDLVFHVDGAKGAVTQLEFRPRATP